MKHLSFSAGTREHRLLHFAEGGTPEKAEAPSLTIDTTMPMENVETKADVDERAHRLVESAESTITQQKTVMTTALNGLDLSSIDFDAIQQNPKVQIAQKNLKLYTTVLDPRDKGMIETVPNSTILSKEEVNAMLAKQAKNKNGEDVPPGTEQPKAKEAAQKVPDVRDFSYAKELQERMNGMKGYEGTRVERGEGTTNEYILTNPDAATIQKLKDFAEARGMKPEMKDGNLHVTITGHEQGLGFFGTDKGADFREKFQSTASINSASKAADDVRDFSYAEELQERANGMRGYEGTTVKRVGKTNEYVVTNENPAVVQQLIQYGESRGMRPRIDEDGNLHVTIIGDEKGVGFYGPDREVKNEKPATEPSRTTYASFRAEKPATTVKPPTAPSSTPVEEKKVDTPQEEDTEKLAELTEARIAAEQACNAGGAPSERMERYDALEAALQEEIQARFAIEGSSPELEALYAYGKNIVQKRSHVVVEYLREKLQEIIKREQSEVKRYENAKANRTAFEYVTQGMSGMKTYDQEIAVSEQAIHSAERVRDRILGKAEELLTKTEVTQKELEELQKIATNVEENITLLNGKKVTHDIWETQEELIDRSRDISILIITAPTAFFTGGGSSAGLVGAMRVGGYMGARSAALHSSIVNTDEVASGNKTVSEGVIDTGIDTAIGGTVGAVTGGAFNRAGAGISRMVNGKTVVPPPVSAGPRPTRGPTAAPSGKAQAPKSAPKTEAPKPEPQARPNPKASPKAEAPKGNPKGSEQNTRSNPRSESPKSEQKNSGNRNSKPESQKSTESSNTKNNPRSAPNAAPKKFDPLNEVANPKMTLREFLNMKPNATSEEINKRAMNLALKLHPDVSGYLSNNINALTNRRINQAILDRAKLADHTLNPDTLVSSLGISI